MSQSAENGPLFGYTRDRSLYDTRPGGSRTPKIHRESVTRPGMAACDSRFILLDIDHPIRLQDDPTQMLRWCLRCFPPGTTRDIPPGDSA